MGSSCLEPDTEFFHTSDPADHKSAQNGTYALAGDDGASAGENANGDSGGTGDGPLCADMSGR